MDHVDLGEALAGYVGGAPPPRPEPSLRPEPPSTMPRLDLGRMADDGVKRRPPRSGGYSYPLDEPVAAFLTGRRIHGIRGGGPAQDYTLADLERIRAAAWERAPGPPVFPDRCRQCQRWLPSGEPSAYCADCLEMRRRAGA